MCELYEVDPDGDLLIILPFSNEAFAPWNDSDDREALPERDPGVEISSPPSTTHEGNLLASYTSPLPLHLKVSSKHLILASRHFRKMLTGNWGEANTIHEDGYRHVTLEGFDPSALKLLLDIIHGKTRKVPRSLDLEMLAKVSVLVDDFECHEEVEVFSDIWLNHLQDSLATEYNRDLILWILISSVFRKSALFKSATRTAILHSTRPIQALGLPIRGIIIGEWPRGLMLCALSRV